MPDHYKEEESVKESMLGRLLSRMPKEVNPIFLMFI